MESSRPSSSRRRHPQWILGFLLTISSLSTSALAENAVENGEAAVKAVQGKWVRQQQGPQGQIRTVKVHEGSHTVVTTYDPQGRVIYAHESDFKLESIGKISVFRSSKRKITAGPDAGKVIETPLSYIYRVNETRFIEAHGLLEDEDETPVMIVWERARN